MDFFSHKRLGNIVTAALFTLCVNFAMASNFCLEVTGSNNSGPFHFNIDENVHISVSDGVFTITSTDQDFVCEVGELSGFNYNRNCTLGVGSTDVSFPVVSITSSGIHIATSSGQSIDYFITDTAGAIVSRGSFTEELNISKQDFSTGVYILRINDMPSIKFIEK